MNIIGDGVHDDDSSLKVDGLLSFSINGNTVNITWTVVNNATNYILWKYNADNNRWIEIINTNNTSYELTLDWNTSSKYSVSAMNGTRFIGNLQNEITIDIGINPVEQTVSSAWDYSVGDDITYKAYYGSYDAAEGSYTNENSHGVIVEIKPNKYIPIQLNTGKFVAPIDITGKYSAPVTSYGGYSVGDEINVKAIYYNQDASKPNDKSTAYYNDTGHYTILEINPSAVCWYKISNGHYVAGNDVVGKYNPSAIKILRYPVNYVGVSDDNAYIESHPAIDFGWSGNSHPAIIAPYDMYVTKAYMTTNIGYVVYATVSDICTYDDIVSGRFPCAWGMNASDYRSGADLVMRFVHMNNGGLASVGWVSEGSQIGTMDGFGNPSTGNRVYASHLHCDCWLMPKGVTFVFTDANRLKYSVNPLKVFYLKSGQSVGSVTDSKFSIMRG